MAGTRIPERDLEELVNSTTSTPYVEATPTLTAGGAYSANDFVGTSVLPITFANAARQIGGSGWVESAILIDGDLQSVAGELWLFDYPIVVSTSDNDAWSIADTDAATCFAVLPFSTYYASALNSISLYDGIARQFKCQSDSANIYGCFVTRGTPTYISGKLSFRLGIIGA